MIFSAASGPHFELSHAYHSGIRMAGFRAVIEVGLAALIRRILFLRCMRDYDRAESSFWVDILSGEKGLIKKRSPV